MISIIIPVFNGLEYLDSFIGSYIEMIERESILHEVIIVDNTSTDNFKSRLLVVIAEKKLSNWHYFSYVEKQSSYAARNYGVSVSKGNILGFVDIDCVFTSNWLVEVNKYQEEKALYVAGNVKLYSQYMKPNIFEAYDFTASFQLERYKKKKVGITANLIVPKDVCVKVGGFDEVMSGGDIAFCQKCQAYHFTYIFDSNLLVTHPARKSYADIVQKMKRVSIGQAKYIKSKKSAYVLFSILKNIIGIILPLRQIIDIKVAFKAYPFLFWLKYSILNLWLGLVARSYIIINLFR